MSNIRLVLVSPLFAGNIGAIARLAANFDVSDVMAVSPRCAFDGVNARMLATGVAAEDLSQIRIVNTLEEALAGCVLRIGFSCRDTLLSLPETQLANSVNWTSETGPLAIIFGREDHGLERSELALCSHICTLPTSTRKSSMNLSHAVAVVLSRIYETNQHKKPSITSEDSFQLATGNDIDLLMERWSNVLHEQEFGERAGGKNILVTKLRNLIVRSRPSFHEVKILHTFLSRISKQSTK